MPDRPSFSLANALNRCHHSRPDTLGQKRPGIGNLPQIRGKVRFFDNTDALSFHNLLFHKWFRNRVSIFLDFRLSRRSNTGNPLGRTERVCLLD